MSATRHLLAALLVIAASCARNAPPAPGVEGKDPTASKIATSPNVITQAEMLNPVVISMDAAKAIRYLRPSFFRTSGPQSFSSDAAGKIQISMDFGPLQPLAQLSMFNTSSLYEVRYLDINEAQGRFGLNANGGPVIVLLTSKQP